VPNTFVAVPIYSRLRKKAAFDMEETPPERLRDYLEKKDPDLATVLNALWLKSAPLHDRQNRPDSNENGRQHVEMVEQNIWRLLTEARDQDGKPNIDSFKARGIFLLSAAACCNDFDKALKSDQPLPESFEHGEGSAAFVVNNAAALGLDEHQAKEAAAAIGIHNLRAGDFEVKLETLSTEEASPDGPFNLRRIAVLLKAADILHCDYSRIQDIGINPDKLAEDQDEPERKLARSKYFARKCTKGWRPDGTRIRVQADPDDAEKLEAFSAAFQYMTKGSSQNNIYF